MTDLTPPVALIAENGIGIHTTKEKILEEYNKIGNYIFTVLKNQVGIQPTSTILDVGCGLGRVASRFTTYLTTGTYCGFDVVRSSIDWCRDRYRDYPNFSFVHADVFSKFYNPEAKIQPKDYKFPFPDDTFDVIWSSSLFTHMLIGDVDNYLSEMARVAKPGGRIWNSYLILDEQSEPRVLGPRNDGRRMMYPVDGGRIGYKDRPELVTGLYKDRVLDLHSKHGFEVTAVQLSNWSGGRPNVKYIGQDVVIARLAA